VGLGGGGVVWVVLGCGGFDGLGGVGVVGVGVGGFDGGGGGGGLGLWGGGVLLGWVFGGGGGGWLASTPRQQGGICKEKLIVEGEGSTQML